MSETLDEVLDRLDRAPWSCGVDDGRLLVAEIRRLRERVAVLDRDGGQKDAAQREVRTCGGCGVASGQTHHSFCTGSWS